MGYALAPSLVVARAEVNAGWPRRDKTSDGWIGDVAHQQTGSDHNPGARGLVHALDVDEDLDGRNVEDGSELLPWFEHLRTSHDPRVKYVIYENRMFSSYPSRGVPAWTWRTYTGKNGHRHHGHISIHSTVTAEQDRRSWFPAKSAGGPAPKTPTVHQEDDLMLIHHPDGRIYLLGPGGATHLGSMRSVDALTKKGVALVSVPDAGDANRIIEDADRPRRLEWYSAALLQTEAREEERDLADDPAPA